MDILHREPATTQAARLILDNLQKQLRDTSTPRKQLIEAITPAFGIRRDPQVIQMIGPERLRDILRSLRNSKPPRGDYGRINELWNKGIATDNTFPIAWGHWRAFRAL